MSKLIKDIMDALNAANQNKTQPYDRQGEVKRIEGKTAWVKLEGSDRETPVQMTIACEVGDTVQARIGGGSAWLTGNMTAPPTDDKKATQALSMATTAVATVQEAVEAVDELEEAIEDLESSDVEDVVIQYCLSDSSSTFIQYGDWSDTPPEYVSGKYYWTRSVIYDDEGNETYGTPRYSQDTQLTVETDIAFNSNNNHFWHDSSGAYVTTADKSYASGSAVRITASGILQQVNGNTVSSWTNSGISFLQGGSTVASFGSGGVNLYGSGYLGARITSSGMSVYSGGTEVATFGSSCYLRSGSDYIYIGQNGFQYYTSNNSTYINRNGDLNVGRDLYCDDATVRGSLDVTGGIDSSSKITAGTYFNSVYTYNNAGGASATTVQNHTVYVASNGNFLMGSSGSTKNIKHDIGELRDKELDPHKLYDLPIIQFVYNKDYLGNEKDCRYDRTLVGFVAEDVAKIYPVAADITDEGDICGWNDRYIIPPMLALIQEQNERITKLEEKLA